MNGFDSWGLKMKKVFLLPVIFLFMVSLFGGMAGAADYLSAENILIVVNTWRAGSQEVGDYYQSKRNVPSENLLQILVTTSSAVDAAAYTASIATPIFDYIDYLNGKGSNIFCILLCYGVPYKIEGTEGVAGTAASVDSELAAKNVTPVAGFESNDYYAGSSRFTSTAYPNMYLVCRIDGPTKDIAKGLVDKAVAADSGVWGKGYFDLDPGYASINPVAQQLDDRILAAYNIATDEGFETVLDESDDLYGGDGSNALWYWGWNQGSYGSYSEIDVYNWNTGAVGCHTCYYGASDIRSDSYWVGGALSDGITATMGNVYEPIWPLVHLADYFFHYYLELGYTFAESASASHGYVSWMGIAVGDPLLKYVAGKEPSPGDTDAPAAPTSLTVTAGNGEASLDWLASISTDVSSYRIYRSTVSGSSYSYTGYVSSSTTSYVSTGLTNGTTYYFVVTAVDSGSNESGYSNQVSAAPYGSGTGTPPDPAPDPTGGGPGGGCFIATACYGSQLAEEVRVLSTFRDECLLGNGAGRAFVSGYYKVSPPLAEFISERALLKSLVRMQLRPWVKIVSAVVSD